MPNRIIKESARTSPTLDAISAEAERMFWRLVTAADDYGRFDADPRVLLAQCFPLKVSTIRVDEVTAWVQEMVAVDLVRLYETKGRTFGYFPAWGDHQRPARSKSKHPAPPRKTLLPDVVGPPLEDHNAPTIVDNPPQSAAIRSVESGVVKYRESLNTESRESGVGSRDGIRRSANGYTIPARLLALWKETYPGVDVDAEIRAAFAWEHANPQRRKVNIQAFLVNWLKREQDRPRPAVRAGPRERQSVPFAVRAAQVAERQRQRADDDTGNVRQDHHGNRARSGLSVHPGGRRRVVGGPESP